jgi:MFS family permease
MMWKFFDSGGLIFAIAVTLLVQTTISFLIAAVPVLASAIASEHHWSGSLIAFYGPLIAIGVLIMSLIVPYLLGRLGGMGLGLACMMLTAIGVLCLLPANAAFAIAVPFLMGLANGGMNPASSQVLGPRTSPRTVGLIMSIKQTGVPLGGVLAGIAAPALVLYFGLETAILALGISTVLLTVMLLPLVRQLSGPGDVRRVLKHGLLDPVKQLIAIDGMLRLQLASTIFVAMQMCLRSFLALYLVDELHFSLAAAGVAFSVSQISGMLGQIGWATISDRLLTANAVMVIIGLDLAIATALCAMFTPDWSFVTVAIAAALFGLGAAGFLPVVFAEIARKTRPEDVGALTSGANLFIVIGVFIGPLVFGAIQIRFGYGVAFSGLACLALIGAFIVLGGGHAKRL